MSHRTFICAVAWAWLAISGGFGAAAPPDAARLDQAASESPEQVALGHLRRACEWMRAAADLEKRCDCHAVDGYYAACEEAWNAIWTCPGSREVLCSGADAYAEALQGLLEAANRHHRLDGEGLRVGPRWRTVCIPLQMPGLHVGSQGIESIEASCRPGDPRITRRHVRGGLGLPVVVRLAAGAPGSVSREFAPARQSLAATAVLRFRMTGDETPLQRLAGPVARDHSAAVLDLANPIEIAAVNMGCARPMLAADLTAPMLDMLESLPRANVVRGFIQPYTSEDTEPRLEFLEPHRRGRIPVVFIHGLASDEGTWFDMLNELRTWPVFHTRYEAWLYKYPTGSSFLRSAATLRSELSRAVEALDPMHDDPALRSLVLVGHSMGGLHAKLQVVGSGSAIWDALACRPFDQMSMPEELRARMAPVYFFHPLPFVKRLIFIATPHRGSTLASLGVGRIASLTVRQPPAVQAVHQELVSMNPGAFRPEYEKQLPTSVDVLEPSSTILQALFKLRMPCWVSAHSIIGDAHASLVGEGGDCIVPVSSTRLPGVVSERFVPATHVRVHHHPVTITEVRGILARHLAETGLESGVAVSAATSGPFESHAIPGSTISE